MAKLRRIKINARKAYRQKKRTGMDSNATFKQMMDAVRAHNALLKLIRRENAQISAAKDGS